MANIFFIMPFRPGFNYMYLHIKDFIESKFDGTKCARGDTTISTEMLISKIRGNIQEADVIIADCSGHNPNVFYEIGVAHALGKNVVLISGRPNEEVPTDIRAYEQINYGFNDHEAFCGKLEQILRSF